VDTSTEMAEKMFEDTNENARSRDKLTNDTDGINAMTLQRSARYS
jgi:hypothetical protein